MSQPIFPSYPPASPNRPSLFELLAEDQLRDLLHPVVKYVLTYFTHRYPRYLLRLLNNHEEFFACILVLLERHHLKRHNASLSEHFYGLRLVPTATMPTSRLSSVQRPQQRTLSKKQRWGMLFFLVGIPYIRARAQDYYERLGGGQDPESLPPDTITPTTIPERLFKGIYPYASLAFDVTLLSYDLAYLFNRTDHYRPWHRLLNLQIARRDPDDEPTRRSMMDKLPPLLPPLLLLLKLSQWWYSPTSPRTIAQAAEGGGKSYHANILPPRPLAILLSSGLLPPTPPLTPTRPSARLQEASDDSLEKNGTVEKTGGVNTKPMFEVTKETYGDCPICGKKWQNPAVLPSGWVVCWKCGFDAVEGEEGDGRCPMTGVPVAPGELRRVLV